MKIPSDIEVYGDIQYRGKCATESAEQATFFNQLTPNLRRLAIHPKNEGKRTHAQAARDKAQGLNTGASDIIIIGAPTFICELKRRDHTKSKITDAQIDFLLNAQAAGAFACIALGYESAMLALDEWLLLKLD